MRGGVQRLIDGRGRFVVLAFVAGMVLASGLIQAARDSSGVDEAVDIAAGLSALEHRDVRMNPEHGLLHHVVPAVLPVLVADPVVPKGPSWERGDWFDYTAAVVDANEDAGRWDDVLFWFRVVPLLATVGSAWFLLRIGERLFGRPEGLLAALLWLLTPYVLGVGHLGALDSTATFMVLALSLSCLRHLEDPGQWRLVELGTVLGGAALVRHTSLLLGVAVVVVIVLADRSADLRRAVVNVAVVSLVTIVTIWLAYRAIDPLPVTGEPRDRFDGLIAAAQSHGLVERLAVSLPLPVEWRAGMAYLFLLDDKDAYLFGQYWAGGRPWFFPASALVKLPLTMTAALVAGALAWVRLVLRDRTPALIAMSTVAGVTILFVLVQPLNLGLRLALPLLALLCVGGGLLVRIHTPLVRRVVVGGVLVVQVIAMVSSHPSSLAWTPVPFHDGYRWVSDGSIDWGQGAGVVERRHAEEPFVAVELTQPRGTGVLPEVPSVVDASDDDLVGEIAVSATVLTVTHARELSWLRAYCPVEQLGGGAILVYRFDAPPDRDAGPAVPSAPCEGETSRRA